MKLARCKSCKREVAKSAKLCPHCGQKNPGLTAMESMAGGLAFIVIVGLLIALFFGSFEAKKSPGSSDKAASSETSDPFVKPKPAADAESLEYMLAALNAGTAVDRNDVTIARFRYLLKQLSERTGYSKEKIGDMTVTAQQHLRENYGRNIGLLDLMEAANKSISGSNIQVKYEQILAALVVLLAH